VNEPRKDEHRVTSDQGGCQPGYTTAVTIDFAIAEVRFLTCERHIIDSVDFARPLAVVKMVSSTLLSVQ